MRSNSALKLNWLVGLLVVIGLLCAGAGWAGSEGDAPKATVSDLAWMTGHWAGALGPNTLEEEWSDPAAGSIAALVRMRGPEKTSMIELIVVEEEGDSLVLRLQQWNPGFEPRTEKPQTFKLKELGERSVSWEAIDEGGMSELAYASPTEDTFTISIVNAQGGAFEIKLKAVN